MGKNVIYAGFRKIKETGMTVHLFLQKQRCRLVLAIGLVLLCGSSVFSQDMASLVKEANQAYRAAEKALFAGDVAGAGAAVAKAKALIDQAVAASPENMQVKTLNNNIQRLAGQIEKKSGTAGAAPAPVASPASAPAATAATSGGALPSGAVQLLREINQDLDRVEKILDDARSVASVSDREASARSHLEEATGGMSTFDQRYGARIAADDPDVKACRDRLAAAEKQIEDFVARKSGEAAAASTAATGAKTASADWVARLQPYVTPSYRPGHDPAKYLIPSASQDQEEMQERVRIYVEATQAMKEFQAAGVSAKTEELTGIEQELETALGQFRDSMKQYGAQNVTEISTKLDQAENFLSTQQKKIGTSETPIPLQKDILPDIRRMIERLPIFLAPNDPQPAELLARLAGLEKMNAGIRQQRVADTRMRSEQYAGGDKGEIVKTAEGILAKAQPGANILRASVVSSDWKEESVLEYTDTTQSAIQHRVTRSVTVEVAAKKADGAFLYTLDVSKDRRTDGSWSPLYGHVMFTDSILEENVGK